MKTAAIICARMKSTRVPNKVGIEYAGNSSLAHLVDRVQASGLNVIVACPIDDAKHFKKILGNRCSIWAGFSEDPLGRMAMAAAVHKLTHVVRITHDKIFIDPNDLNKCLDQYYRYKPDYAYSSNFIPGTSFEIFPNHILQKAADKYQDVEHISYAIKTIAEDVLKLEVPSADIWSRQNMRLLVDYPEDVDLMHLLFNQLGPKAQLSDVKKYLLDNQQFLCINELPKVTVYTCAYNAQSFINECLDSVSGQQTPFYYEYIVVNDASDDKTLALIHQYKIDCMPDLKIINNPKNLGLASSCNLALKQARGEYIIRLDADDFFSGPDSLQTLHTAITHRELDALYPANYYGSVDAIQEGKAEHHIGGAMFKTRAVNHVKFTDGLRGYEGLDFFTRAKDRLKIGYLSQPMFFYRQHKNSLSRTNIEERERLKRKILNGEILNGEDVARY